MIPARLAEARRGQCLSRLAR
eukprot:SAG11_NODE_36734_length_260_cov_0.639752_1_plen_20_part_01